MKNKIFRKNIKDERAITLIALVITCSNFNIDVFRK